jgi:hypothetical protein
MKTGALGWLVVLMCWSNGAVSAHARKNTPGKREAALLTATVQRTLPGARGAEPFETRKFLLVWSSPTPPETFFWRPDGERWMTCVVSRVHHYGQHKMTKDPQESPYQTEQIRLQDVHRGDTLELAPMAGGRDVMPASVKGKPRKAVYYRTEKGAWQPLAINKEQRLPDIIMP